MHEATFTPPELAARWRVKPSMVLAWIRSSELTAFDVSNRTGVGRPRYRVPAEAVELFAARRSASPASKPRKKRAACSGREYV